jgi:hypothetical protein
MADSGMRVAMRSGRVRPVLFAPKEDTAMKDDLVVVAGVLLASAVCAWYVVQAIAGVVHPIPTDDTCTTATQCLALAMGH